MVEIGAKQTLKYCGPTGSFDCSYEQRCGSPLQSERHCPPAKILLEMALGSYLKETYPDDYRNMSITFVTIDRETIEATASDERKSSLAIQRGKLGYLDEDYQFTPFGAKKD